jgi:Xaa-Pro aminopeptidase
MNTRIQRAQSLLLAQGLDLLIVNDPVNLFYFTGIELSQGCLFLSCEQAYLAVDMRYYEKVKKQVPLSLLHLEEAPLSHVLDKESSCKTVAFDDTVFSSHQELLLRRQIAQFRKQKRPLTLKRASSFLQEMRSIKEKGELSLLQKAADLGVEGYKYLLSLLHVGISERELEKQLRLFWLERGADDVAFSPIIAFGENSAIPHHSCSLRTLRKGDIVLIDIGVKKGRYCSDMTRTLFFGPPQPQLKEIYQLVQEAQLLALEKCRLGVPFKEVDRAARSFLEKQGYGKEFCHSLGHGVGLEIHEAPALASYHKEKKGKLQPGHVITIEPGIYLPGIGGVRIEDTVAIEERGILNFTNSSKELLILS